MTQLFDSETKVYSVSELSRAIHDALEETFPEIWVEGEVSDPRTFPSGHTYFTLKDSESQIAAVLFKGAGASLKFELTHGLVVLARGRVSTYVKRGQYQFIASSLQPKAKGALQLAFEQLKAKLAAEGLFAPERKKRIPAFPRRIGIVTSLQGAALRDILSVLRRRFDGLHVRIHPVLVQGDEAAGQIAGAIEDFNRHFADTDVLLVGRGGGSLEELRAFNEEAGARAIAASRIPVISCVGHETDFTIADFTADLRAPTPSAAAELVVQNKEEVLKTLSGLRDRLPLGLAHLLKRYEERLKFLSQSPLLRSPARLLEEPARRLDELAARGLQALEQSLRHAEKDLRLQAEKLSALSPLGILSRGYAIAFQLPGGAVVRSSRHVHDGDRVRVRLGEGEFIAEVRETRDSPPETS
ncbi:MAG: exodeoxyribonuclease VII large subunit [Elusimicrobia bacterium]|nr:exodeoxyribonuclease VII large subunit [Elusimicrobiota bacterium]